LKKTEIQLYSKFTARGVPSSNLSLLFLPTEQHMPYHVEADRHFPYWIEPL